MGLAKPPSVCAYGRCPVTGCWVTRLQRPLLLLVPLKADALQWQLVTYPEKYCAKRYMLQNPRKSVLCFFLSGGRCELE